MSLEITITEEMIARQSAEAQVIIRLLLAHLVKQDRRIAELEARLKLSPRNSSLPPSSEHPHSKPERKKSRSRKKARRSAGASQA